MSNIHDDAQAWYESMGQEIQDFDVPPMPETEPSPEQQAEIDEAQYMEDHPYADAPRVSNEDATSVLNMQRINRPTATVIVGTMDVFLPIVITMIIKGSERDDAKLQESERETLIEAWAAYLGDKNVQASPGMVLITTILTIYGSKVYTCIQHRNEIRQAEIIAEQQEQLRRQEEELKALRAARETADDKEKKTPKSQNNNPIGKTN